MNNRNGKQRSRARSNKKGQDRGLLKELVNVNRAQTVKDLPDTRDVIWPTLKPHKIHTFVRKQNFGQITGSVTAEVDGALAFSLGSLPDYTEFTALYDTYRIMMVKVDFFPLFTDTSATVAYPPIITAIDYDDNASTTYAVLQEYSTSLVSCTGQFFQRVMTPKVALAAYGGAFTQFAQAPAGQWLDCASPNTTHYGLKYALPITGAANAVWQVWATYLLQLRESR